MIEENLIVDNSESPMEDYMEDEGVEEQQEVLGQKEKEEERRQESPQKEKEGKRGPGRCHGHRCVVGPPAGDASGFSGLRA